MNMEEEETKFCTNCKRDIATRNFVMHDVHCHRNIVLCRKCEEPVPKSDLDAHNDEFHAMVPCDKCGSDVLRPSLENHQINECAKRLVKCSFCEVDKCHDDLEDHEQFCGTRTEQCPLCNQFIMKQDQAVHDQTNCQYPQSTVNSEPRVDRPEFGRLNSFALNELSRITEFPIVRNDISQRLEKNETRRRTEKNLRSERSYNSHFNQNVETDGTNYLDSDDELQMALRLSNQVNEMPTGSGNNLGGDWLRHDTGFERHNTLLPCEFCHQLCESDDLVRHESACNDQNGQLSFETALQARARGASVDETPSNQQDSVPGDNWIYNAFPSEFTSTDETLLPCEFCDEPYPMDFLVQHQSVCDMNRTQTPFPTRPNNRRPAPESPPIQRTSRRQQDPNVFQESRDARLAQSKTVTKNTLGARPSANAANKPTPRNRSTNFNGAKGEGNTRNNHESRRRSSDEPSTYEPSFVTTAAPRRPPQYQRGSTQNQRGSTQNQRGSTQNQRGEPNPRSNRSNSEPVDRDVAQVSDRMNRSSLEPTMQPRNNFHPRSKRRPEK